MTTRNDEMKRMNREMSFSKEKKADSVSVIITVFLLSMICWIIAGLLRKLYADVDNFTISTVVNGLYDDDNYCIYLHPFLCKLIKALSFFWPRTDIFLLVGHILVFTETMWLFYLSLNNEKNLSEKIMLCSLNFFNIIAIGLYNVNYTIQAASFVFTGTISLFLSFDRKKENLYVIVGTLFVCFGFMWRIRK